MLRFLAFTCFLLAAQSSRAAPAVTGLWLTETRDGVIAISPCGDDLCAHIVGVVLDHPNDKMPVDNRGVTQCHLPLITDARQVRSNLWKGHITDPRNGDHFGVEFHLDPHGSLALRGFLGLPLLGHTQTWTRYTGTVPANCRLYANGQREANR
jgi:uncharacterized protein (DUF2147 family)